MPKRRKLLQGSGMGSLLPTKPILVFKKGQTLGNVEARARIRWMGELRRLLHDPYLGTDDPTDIYYNCGFAVLNEWDRKVGRARASGQKKAREWAAEKEFSEFDTWRSATPLSPAEAAEHQAVLRGAPGEVAVRCDW